MSDTNLSKSKSEKLEKLKESLWVYNEASSMIAYAEHPGHKCEVVFMVLKRFQELRQQLEKDILTLDPNAFKPASEGESNAQAAE